MEPGTLAEWGAIAVSLGLGIWNSWTQWRSRARPAWRVHSNWDRFDVTATKRRDDGFTNSAPWRLENVGDAEALDVVLAVENCKLTVRGARGDALDVRAAVGTVYPGESVADRIWVEAFPAWVVVTAGLPGRGGKRRKTWRFAVDAHRVARGAGAAE